MHIILSLNKIVISTNHGHYGEILYQGYMLVTFICDKSTPQDISQSLPKVELLEDQY